MANARQTWPYNGASTSPAAKTLTADGLLRSDRRLAGPLRLGTAPGVGPGGFRPGGPGGDSDFGVDRVTPRRFDPMGNSNRRAPEFPTSRRIDRNR